MEVYLVCTDVMMKTIVSSVHRTRLAAVAKCLKKNKEYERRYKVEANFFILTKEIQE